ncbi:MAG: site-specific DNA-methyltransferase [Candidatus Caldatribacteriota bacterium]
MIKIEVNRFYIGEAAEIMCDMPANFVDLTITSPPYDKMRSYEGSLFTFEDFKSIAKQLYRVTKPGGVVVWIVGDQTKDGTESLTSFKHALYFKDGCGFKIHDTMIYEKTGFSNPSSNRYHQIFEYMFVLVKGKLKTFNPIKDRKNIYAGQTRWGKNTIRQFDGSLKERSDTKPTQEYGMRFNIWRISAGGNVSTPDKIAFDHPAIFPEQLAKDHILSWSNEGDLVLDPLCGSGTTCKMAHLLNRNWIGIDMVQKYITIAGKRLENYGWKKEI